MGWLILATYLIGWVITARLAAPHILDTDAFSYGNKEPDTEDKIMARLFGFLVGMLWPVLLVAALMTGNLPKSPQQLRRDVEQRDERIRELETELGIGQEERSVKEAVQALISAGLTPEEDAEKLKEIWPDEPEGGADVR